MERTMKVTGIGNISISPDMTEITLKLSNVMPDYEATLEKSVNDLQEIVESLQQFGFKREDLKTSYFNISQKVEGHYDQNNVYQKKFIGYQYDEDLKFKFMNNNILLGEILSVLSNLYVNPAISINYVVSDEETVKNKLIEEAVNDAMEKARILSISANVLLGNIINIDYSLKKINYETSPYILREMNTVKSYNESSYKIDIQPDEIKASDEVTIIYQIL